MRLFILSGVLALAVNGLAQTVFTYPNLNRLQSPIVSGNRMIAFSDLNDGKSSQAFVTSIASDGKVVWTTPLQSVIGNYASHMLPAPQGGVTLFGSQYRTRKVAIARVDSAGHKIWKLELPSIQPHHDQNICISDEKGNSVIYHGPTPSLSSVSNKGKLGWTYKLDPGARLDSISTVHDKTFAIMCRETGGKGTSVVELDKHGRVVTKRIDEIKGLPVAVSGKRLFVQEAGKTGATYRCFNLESGSQVWQSAGPLARPKYASVGASGELTLGLAQNAALYTLVQFNGAGALSWVKELPKKSRLDGIRLASSSGVQALVVNYDMSETAVEEYAGGVRTHRQALPFPSLSGSGTPFAALNGKLYVFQVVESYKPGETGETGLRAKLWRIK